jgi:hypothetical protein
MWQIKPRERWVGLMIRFSWVLAFIVAIAISLPDNAGAARQTREEMERAFKYGWSQSATLIFYGTVASVDYKDDPKERNAHVELMIRAETIQRGVPGNSMVKVQIEDELQTYRWQGTENRIGETGIWFLHRVRQYEGAPPRGYLIRYMDQTEMDEDPAFLAELMKYVIQDTVDKTIRPNILNLLAGENEDSEKASMKIDLEYDEFGALENIEVVERSENLLFNDHVFDTILQIHRRIRIPGQVRQTQISIAREVL